MGGSRRSQVEVFKGKGFVLLKNYELLSRYIYTLWSLVCFLQSLRCFWCLFACEKIMVLIYVQELSWRVCQIYSEDQLGLWWTKFEACWLFFQAKVGFLGFCSRFGSCFGLGDFRCLKLKFVYLFSCLVFLLFCLLCSRARTVPLLWFWLHSEFCLLAGFWHH